MRTTVARAEYPITIPPHRGHGNAAADNLLPFSGRFVPPQEVTMAKKSRKKKARKKSAANHGKRPNS
jgi:hypothetical protein